VSGRGWKEVAIGLGAYGAYLLVRQAVWTPAGRARAAANAVRIDAAEQRWGVAAERPVQQFVLRAPRLVDVLNASYAAANVALSVGWLGILHRRGDDGFLTERRAAVIAFVGALPVFALLPTAPPRTLPGFVDTMAERGLDLDHPLLTRLYNPIAALPSHHVAFATVTGLGLARRARSPWARAAWRAYPVGVALVVIGTANHFVTDVVAGAALGLVARGVAR
jgi:hypothetical protein